jgi:hypothetical protein
MLGVHGMMVHWAESSTKDHPLRSGVLFVSKQ